MMTRAEREVLEWRWFVVGGQLAVLEADCGSACLLAALSDLSPFGSFFVVVEVCFAQATAVAAH
jgi:hypothetical protein